MNKRTVTYERDSKLPEWVTPAILKAMHDDGNSLRKIAKQFGVSHEAIRLLIKRAKVS